MVKFQFFLGFLLLVLLVYTGIVGFSHGWNLIPVFFGDMAAMAWPGQFNTDFMCFLLLSGLWVAWRHRFSTGGLCLGAVAVFGGMLFLSIYLLIMTRRCNGDIEQVLLGPSRVNG